MDKLIIDNIISFCLLQRPCKINRLRLVSREFNTIIGGNESYRMIMKLLGDCIQSTESKNGRGVQFMDILSTRIRSLHEARHVEDYRSQEHDLLVILKNIASLSTKNSIFNLLKHTFDQLDPTRNKDMIRENFDNVARTSEKFKHVLVRGASMSGKTTIAYKIQKKLGRGALTICCNNNNKGTGQVINSVQFAKNELEKLIGKTITTHGDLTFFLMKFFVDKLTVPEAVIISKSILHGNTFMCTEQPGLGNEKNFFTNCGKICRDKIFKCELETWDKIFIPEIFIFEVLHYQMSVQKQCFQNRCFIIDDYEILPFAFCRTIDEFMLNPYNKVIIFTDTFMYPSRNSLESCIRVDMNTSMSLPAGICQLASNLYQLNYNTYLPCYTANIEASFRDEIVKGDNGKMFTFINKNPQTMVYVVSNTDRNQFIRMYNSIQSKRVVHIHDLLKGGSKRKPHDYVVIWTDVYHPSTIETIGKFLHLLNTGATGCKKNLFIHDNIFFRYPFLLDYIPYK